MKQLIFSAIFLGTIIITGNAMGQTRTPRITERQHQQQQRIKQGIHNGSLTRGETRQLERRERKIQHDKKLAKSDGFVTTAERRKIYREENRTSRAIYRKKHNAITQ